MTLKSGLVRYRPRGPAPRRWGMPPASSTRQAAGTCWGKTVNVNTGDLPARLPRTYPIRPRRPPA